MYAQWMVLFCTASMVIADYEVEIRAESFVNTRSTVVNRSGQTGADACCDLGDEGCNTGSEQCDIYLVYCFRALNTSTLDPCDSTLPDSTTSVRNNENTLTGSDLNGIHENNPFTFRISLPWQGTQLYVRGFDSDTNDDDVDNVDDLIDTFKINLPPDVLGQQITYSLDRGENGIASLILTITVECAESFSGDQCLSMDVCEGVDCNSGTCQPVGSDFVCECDPGFTGPTCDHMDFCADQTCSSNGDCINQETDFECSCNPGFNGTLCENNIDECVGVDCGEGNCTDLINDFMCVCPPGLSGHPCSIQLVNNTESPGSIAGGIIGAGIILTFIVILAVVVSILIYHKFYKQEAVSATNRDTVDISLDGQRDTNNDNNEYYYINEGLNITTSVDCNDNDDKEIALKENSAYGEAVGNSTLTQNESYGMTGNEQNVYSEISETPEYNYDLPA